MSSSLIRKYGLLVLAAFVLIAGNALTTEAQKKGGILKVGNLGEPPSLDAHWTTASITETLTNHIYEGSTASTAITARSRCWPRATR